MVPVTPGRPPSTPRSPQQKLRNPKGCTMGPVGGETPPLRYAACQCPPAGTRATPRGMPRASARSRPRTSNRRGKQANKAMKQMLGTTSGAPAQEKVLGFPPRFTDALAWQPGLTHPRERDTERGPQKRQGHTEETGASSPRECLARPSGTSYLLPPRARIESHGRTTVQPGYDPTLTQGRDEFTQTGQMVRPRRVPLATRPGFSPPNARWGRNAKGYDPRTA